MEIGRRENPKKIFPPRQNAPTGPKSVKSPYSEPETPNLLSFWPLCLLDGSQVSCVIHF